MSRSTELFLRSALNILTVVLLTGGAVLVLNLLFMPSEPKRIELPADQPADPKTDDGGGQEDASQQMLVSKRMTKRITAQKSKAKNITPSLDSLIRVKGIMDFGDPKTNEALIEILKSRKTVSCTVGQTVEGVGAVVFKIDEGVTFKYDNKTIKLKIDEGKQVNARFLASPDEAVQGKDWVKSNRR